MGHLVVGVGGTGFKALCMLKAQLQNSNPQGILPQGVSLLALDTESPSEALVAKADTIASYGGVPLHEPTEYVWLGENGPPIGANLLPVGQALLNNGMPTGGPQVQQAPVGHITAWFQAKTMLCLLLANQWNVNVGASQHRQLSRLALFWNVQNPQTSVFHRKLTTAMTRAATSNDLNVYLIGSTVGGTGAGLFVDVAYLLRQFAKQSATTCTVTAFLLLPESFSAVLGGNALPQAQARTYACLREMERFSVGLMQHTRGFKMTYNPLSPLAAYQGAGEGTTEKLLDAIYYIDGVNPIGNDGMTLNRMNPDQGCIPLVSDIALALLSQSGADRRAHMTNVATIALQNSGVVPPNLMNGGAQAYTTVTNNSIFSSGCGTYSIILPMAQIIDRLSWQLVSATVNLMAVPGVQAGQLDSNRPGGSAGRNEVAEFCAMGVVTGQHRNPATQQYESLSASSAELLQDIQDQGQQYGDGTNLSQTQQVARVFNDRVPRQWQQRLTLQGTTIGTQLTTLWESELDRNFVTTDPKKPVLVPVSPPNQDCKRQWSVVTSDVDRELVSIIGNRKPDGTYSGGTLQGVLNITRPELLTVLRRRMWIWSLNILNGSQPQPADVTNVAHLEKMRGNSLGYFQDFLAELGAVLGAYQQALATGRAMRNSASGKAARIQNTFDTVRQRGDENPCPGLFNRGAEGLRREFLDAAQALLDLRRTEQIEQMVLEVVQTFATDVEQLRRATLQWGTHLTIGGSAAVAQRATVEQTRAMQAGQRQDSPLREKIWDDEYIQQLYNQYGGGAINVLSQMNWWLLQPGEQGRSSFDMQLYHNTERFADATTTSSGLYQLARTTFKLAWERESILNYLQSKSTPKWQPAEISARLQAGSQIALSAGGAGIDSIYLVIPNPNDQLALAYRNQLQGTIQTSAAGKPMQVLAGSDPFRITYIAWRDLIGVEKLSSFSLAEPQYNNMLSLYQYPNPQECPPRFTRETLHVMPGEVHAVGIEARLARVQVHPSLVQVGQSRRLHYEVIQQLEDVGHVRKFLAAWTWGVISERSRRTNNNQPVRVYGFEIEPRGGSITRSLPPQEYWLNEPTSGNPTLLEALWDWNYDWRDRHPNSPDDQGRQRPNPNFNTALFSEIDEMIRRERTRRLDEWIAAHPNWFDDVTPADQARFQRATSEQQARARLTWAESKFLQTRLQDLHDKELAARGAPGVNGIQKEQDTIAMLMVLLWEDIENLEQSWNTHLQQVYA